MDGFVIRGGVETDGELLVIKGARAEEAQRQVESWLQMISATLERKVAMSR